MRAEGEAWLTLIDRHEQVRADLARSSEARRTVCHSGWGEKNKKLPTPEKPRPALEVSVHTKLLAHSQVHGFSIVQLQKFGVI